MKSIFKVLINDSKLNNEKLTDEEIDFVYKIITENDNITDLLNKFPELNKEQLSKYFLVYKTINYCSMYFS